MEAELPSLFQTLGVIVIAVIGFFVGIIRYVKGETAKEKKEDVGSMVTASFIDTKVLRELIDAILTATDEMARENRKALRAQQELKDTMIELSESIKLHTDATLNMVRFIKQRDIRKEFDQS